MLAFFTIDNSLESLYLCCTAIFIVVWFSSSIRRGKSVVLNFTALHEPCTRAPTGHHRGHVKKLSSQRKGESLLQIQQFRIILAMEHTGDSFGGQLGVDKLLPAFSSLSLSLVHHAGCSSPLVVVFKSPATRQQIKCPEERDSRLLSFSAATSASVECPEEQGQRHLCKTTY